jgi:MFS family permease
MLSIDRLRDGLRSATAGLPRSFWIICAGIFVNRIGGFVLPFLALYLTQALHLSLARAGLVIALYGAGGAAAGPVGGYLADHVGRRFTMVTALGLGGVGMIALGMTRQLPVLAPMIFLVALVSEMYRPAMQAAVADLVDPADRLRAFGLVYWVINVGFAIGLTLGGLIAARSFLWLFIGDGITTLMFGLLILTGVPETHPHLSVGGAKRPAHARSGFFAPYRDLHFVLFLVLSFFIALVFMQNATSFPVDMTAKGISRSVFGRVLALNGVVIVLVQPFLGPFLARRDRSHTLAVGSALIALGFGLNALASTVSLYVLSVVIWTVGEMGVLPVANAVVADLAPPDVRGRYQGAYGLAFGSAVCLAPALGMFVLGRLGSVTLWSGCLVIGLIVSAGHLARSRVLARRNARMSPVPVPEPH